MNRFFIRVLLLLSAACHPHLELSAQNLFFEECFAGGVTVSGISSLGIVDGTFAIYWPDGQTLKRAYILTYRYDRPSMKSFILNDQSYLWDGSSQFGSELEDIPNVNNYFAVHIQDITEDISMISEENTVYMDGTDFENSSNGGFYSIMAVFLYERADVQDTICFEIYTASQNQLSAQEYLIHSLSHNPLKDVAFSIYAERIGQDESDDSVIGINGSQLGIIGNRTIGGVQGHFYYENGELYGLDDDVPNNTVNGTDGLAVINEYLTDTPTQNILISAVELPAVANPHPAFFITYTPDCPDMVLGEMERQVGYCAGDSAQLQAMEGYDHYHWMPGHLVSDSTIANPWCRADSSMWLRVHMYNDADGGACSQTIPVTVTVHDIPRPGTLNILASTCPANSGRVQATNIPGTAPFWHQLNGVGQSAAIFNNLAPGTYPYRITSAAGCVWDTVINIPLNPPHEADFRVVPPGGFSPLEVFFGNQSTNATTYIWLLDGVPVSQSTNWRQHFADSGTYEIALVAYYDGLPSCTDTAFYTLRIDQGLELLIPNIISPNGDGRNDALVAQIAGVAELRWQVFNRWGQLMHTGEQNGLDGESQIELWRPEAGENLPDAPYTLTIQAIGSSGQRSKVASQVMVVE